MGDWDPRVPGKTMPEPIINKPYVVGIGYVDIGLWDPRTPGKTMPEPTINKPYVIGLQGSYIRTSRRTRPRQAQKRTRGLGLISELALIPRLTPDNIRDFVRRIGTCIIEARFVVDEQEIRIDVLKLPDVLLGGKYTSGAEAGTRVIDGIMLYRNAACAAANLAREQQELVRQGVEMARVRALDRKWKEDFDKRNAYFALVGQEAGEIVQSVGTGVQNIALGAAKGFLPIILIGGGLILAGLFGVAKAKKKIREAEQ